MHTQYPPTLAGAVDRWLDTYNSPSTARSYWTVLSRFTRETGPERPLHEVTPEDVDRWLARLRSQTELFADHPSRPMVKKKPSPATIANRIRTVKTFFNWCVRCSFIDESPSRFISSKRFSHVKLRSKAIPAAVLRGMFQALGNKPPFTRLRDCCILTLMATYGARVGDVCSVRLPMIDLESRRITFLVKGGKEHTVPKPSGVAEVVRAWLEIRCHVQPDPPHNFVFVTNRTTKGNAYQGLRTSGMEQIIFRLSQQVCGRRWGPHSIRHWRGQSLADARVAPTIIQALLGHSNVGTTMEFYFNQDEERLASTIESFEVTPHRRPGVPNPKVIPFPQSRGRGAASEG